MFKALQPRCWRTGIDDVTPKGRLLAAKAHTISTGYNECLGYISAYKQARGGHKNSTTHGYCCQNRVLGF